MANDNFFGGALLVNSEIIGCQGIGTFCSSSTGKCISGRILSLLDSRLCSLGSQVAPEFEARIAQIRAVEDEDTVCLGDRFGEPTVMVEHDTTEVVDVDSNTNKHFDAIFAPTGSLSQRVNAPTSSSVMPRPGGSSDTPEVTAGTVTPAISIGAAERTRLVLKGKVEEASRLKKKITPKFESMTRVDNNAQSSAEQEQGQTPLFKTLKVCPRVSENIPAILVRVRVEIGVKCTVD